MMTNEYNTNVITDDVLQICSFCLLLLFFMLVVRQPARPKHMAIERKLFESLEKLYTDNCYYVEKTDVDIWIESKADDDEEEEG